MRDALGIDAPRSGWAACVRTGLAAAGTQWRVVGLVWATFLALAWIAALPAWRWWDRMLAYAPEGDRLLEGLNLPLLHELVQYDRSPTVAIALGSAWTFLLLALVLNPFVAGGILGVLRASTSSGVARRFAADGVRFYWRFARVLLIVGVVGSLLAMALMLVMSGAAAELGTRGWERTGMWLGDASLIAAMLMFGLTSLVIDLARVHILRADDPRAVAGVMQAARFLGRHAGATFGVALTFVVVLAVAIAVYALVAASITPRAWPLILFAIAWQQVFSVARTGLRVAMLGALSTLVDDRSPLPAHAVVSLPALSSEPPISELPPLA